MALPLIGVGALALGAAALGGYAWRNTGYADRDAAKVRAAGFSTEQVTVADGVGISFLRGPQNGPPLLLLHAQSADAHSYDRVLPALAREFTVYVPDLPGHGASDRTPGRYDIGFLTELVVDFCNTVIGRPVLVSGHSSGGLLAAAVGAAIPAQVRGLLLEDPPFFSTEAERMPQQFNYVDLATPAHRFLQQDAETDFVSWYIEHNAWIGYLGKGAPKIIEQAQRYRRRHPDRRLNLWFLPPSVNQTFAAMHLFDPRFADAFHELTWQAGFDQAATLGSLSMPATLVHANWRVTGDGILEGAMTDDDASRACGLMGDCRLARVDTGHGFHFEAPERFVHLLRRVADRAATSVATT
ncbi:alpha/beta fold hydrolase [Naumannella halotolerans]|uniref:alpha/beta fold hydrolase n=1 Tax=Naumannella halotolerans TaxID=993414 RepID=UPI00370DC70C